MIKGKDTLIFGDDHDESTGSDGPRDSVVDAKTSQTVKVSYFLVKVIALDQIILSKQIECQ